MGERSLVVPLDPRRREQGLVERGNRGGLKRVGSAVDLTAVEPAASRGEQEIARGQEVLEGAGSGRRGRSRGRATDFAGGGRGTGPEPLRGVGDRSLGFQRQ